MATDISVKDLVAFIIKNYPFPEQLTRGRLAKLVYLIDAEYTRCFGDQLTNITWYFADNGPFPKNNNTDQAVKELERKELVKIHKDLTGSRNKKQWYEFIAIGEIDIKLGKTVEDLIRSIIEETKDMGFVKFIRDKIYNSLPVTKSEPYEIIDIVEVMEEEREKIMERAKQKMDRDYGRMMKALADS